ncbi:MAG: hypothetical protein JW908_10245 [Anaerolineales bacterium]|nr:hypothetical protein [Anaerolineales bacterium]
MHKSKLFKISFLLALMLALCAFGVAMAEGEPTGADDTDCHPPKITVIKDSIPDADEDFSFTLYKKRYDASSWSVLESFVLDGYDNTTKTNEGLSTSYYYKVVETIPSSDPWTLTEIACVVKDPNGYVKTDLTVTTSITDGGKSGYAKFRGTDARYVTCTFTNTMQDLDYGDLPEGDDPYDYNMTTFANDGARHISGDLFLGESVDTESDGQPTQLATGDDDNNDDEDGGVRASSPEKWISGEGAVDVTVGGTGTGCLSAWMDIWNTTGKDPITGLYTGALGADGDFDDSGNTGGIDWSEQIIVNQLVTAGQSYNFTFNLPPDSGTYNMYSRFRLVPENGDGVCGDASPTGNSPEVVFVDDTPKLTGLVVDGEVEDYVFAFDPTAVSLQSFTASPFTASTALLVTSVLGVGLLGVFFSARKKS